MTPGERLECLAMRKLDIQLPAVTFDQAEGVQLARCTVVNQRSEVSPIDLKTLARNGFHTHKGTPDFGFGPHGVQMIFDNRVASGETSIA